MLMANKKIDGKYELNISHWCQHLGFCCCLWVVFGGVVSGLVFFLVVLFFVFVFFEGNS